MAVLSDQELAQLAYEAGFRGEALRWAVAIAKAESGGNPSAYNPEIAAGTPVGSGSRGLWQIYGVAHPQYNSSLAFDPRVNAQAAYQVYQQAGYKFTPWSTYNNGMAAGIVNQINIGTPSKTTRQRSNQKRTTTRGTTGTSAPSGIEAQIAQNTQALQDVASGKFIENIFSKVDTVSLSFYLGGAVLMLIGLLVIFYRPAVEVTKEVVKTAATGAVAAAL